MALTVILELPGVTQQQYDQVIDRITPDRKSPQGQILHVGGPIEGGWCVVDVWESQEAFERFLQQKLIQAMQEAGMPPPQRKVFPVYNMIERTK